MHAEVLCIHPPKSLPERRAGVSSALSASTDANGHYAIIAIKAGIYTIEVSTESGDTISKTVHIRYGRIEELDFDL